VVFSPENAADVRFHWSQSTELLEDLLDAYELVLDASGGMFVCPDDARVHFRPPAVQPITELTQTPRAWLNEVHAPGTYVIVLVQAGASAMGWFEDEACLAHKALKRYVSRGKGRAQLLHLKTKGKSRYGSRLRLQNAARQIVETSTRLNGWWEELGKPERVFGSIPVRTWPVLLAAVPPPPFVKDDVIRVRHHVHVPNHAELMRVQRLLLHGEFVR